MMGNATGDHVIYHHIFWTDFPLPQLARCYLRNPKATESFFIVTCFGDTLLLALLTATNKLDLIFYPPYVH